jgi:DNA-binding CsgD family transcriptional regulator
MNDIQHMLKVYKSTVSDKFKSLTIPLKTHLGIDECIYTYISNKGDFYAISNQPEPSIHYFSQRFYTSTLLIRHPENYLDGALLPASIANEARESSMEDKFGYSSDSLLAIFKRNNSGVHKFLFNRKHGDVSMTSFYLRNLKLFESFCDYFLKEWEAHRAEMEKYTIDIASLIGPSFFEITYPGQYPNEKKLRMNFLKDIGVIPKDFMLPQSLSPQEKKCLEWIYLGKTLKETAEYLDLSQRTVEYYFENIKNKFGCRTKSELLEQIQYIKLIET